jgi:type IV secretory pathway VirB2 component (pilin)
MIKESNLGLLRTAGTGVRGCKTRRIMTGPVARWCHCVAVVAVGMSAIVAQVQGDNEF